MIYQTVVIGGGQCGLYPAKALEDRGIDYSVLEKELVGSSWRKRLEGMSLFTSRQFCGLPELPFSGEPCGFPTAQEMAVYLVSWLDIDSCVSEQEFVHAYGPPREKGFYVVGRKWLSCRASELVVGVEHDVNRVLDKLECYLDLN